MTGDVQTEFRAEPRAYMPQAKTTDYETPHDLFDQLDQEFGPFDLDPCGQRETHYSAWKITHRGGLCYDGSTPVLDGLTQPWRGKVYMNPPYGREMPRWVERAVGMVEDGIAELVVALIPSRTDTRMWQRYVLKQTGPMRGVTYCVDAHPLLEVVRFLPGRLKFGGMKAPAPFPSAVVVWRAP